MKIIKKFEKLGCEIEMDDIIDDKHLDSFWYDGTILSFKLNNQTWNIVACGIIRINKNDELVFDCKERNAGFGINGFGTDEDLAKITEENGFEWIHNNWFEIEIDGEFDGRVGHNLDDMVEEVKILMVNMDDEDDLEENLKIVKTELEIIYERIEKEDLKDISLNLDTLDRIAGSIRLLNKWI